MMPKDVNQMLNEIRSVINQYGELPERDVYTALVTESKRWQSKLDEEDDEDDEDWDDDDDDDWDDDDDDWENDDDDED
jgi:hypothetical protein